MLPAGFGDQDVLGVVGQDADHRPQSQIRALPPVTVLVCGIHPKQHAALLAIDRYREQLAGIGRRIDPQLPATTGYHQHFVIDPVETEHVLMRRKAELGGRLQSIGIDNQQRVPALVELGNGDVLAVWSQTGTTELRSGRQLLHRGRTGGMNWRIRRD